MNAALEPGQVIGGRWQIDQYLASGGFGQVYAATDISTASIGAVAVKILLEGASTAERQSFLAEAVHMSALRHPNLVAHIDSGMLTQDDGAVYLVIDLCDESLREHCERQTSGTMRPERLAGLIGDIGAGLDYLHQSGRVHRDLKPGNILRAGDRWKVADFGLVRDLSRSGVYHLQSLVGSPRYMAPEFFSDGTVGPAADIWAVGVIVHEIMTGQTVYRGEGPAYIHSVTSGPPEIAPGLAPTTEDLIRRCLDPEPDRRPAAADLAAILAGTAPAQPGGIGQRPAADDVTMEVAPPPGVAPGMLATSSDVGTGSPAGAAPPPAFPPPTGPPAATEPPAAVAPVAANLGASAGAPPAGPAGPGHGQVPVLPPAPTEDAGGSSKRIAVLAGLGAVLLLALGAWAIASRGGDETETASTDIDSDAAADGDATDTDGDGTDPAGATTDAPDESDPSDDDTAGADSGSADDTDDGADEDGTDQDDGGDQDGEGEDQQAAASPGPRAGVALDGFVPGECADVDNVQRFVIDTVVPCTDPHLFQVLSVYEAPQAGGAYPGADALFQLGVARCPQAFLDRYGTDQADTSLSVLSFGPSEEEWDQQIYSVVCAMYRSDLQPLQVPVGDDVSDWLWKPGDSLTAVELQRGFCFDTPVPLEIQGFGQRVLYADCEDPHDGQYYDSVLLEQPEGGYTDPLEILADGKPLCHDALHERYGDDHRESGFTDTVMVQNPAEYQQSPTNLLLCIVLWDEPTAGTLEDIVAE